MYKISEVSESPNIADLLKRKVFDLVINIPTRKEYKESKEFTDGKLIRQATVKTGIPLIADIEVAIMTLQNILTVPKINTIS